MPNAAHTAEAVIAALGLAPHPEGGWYRETWRAAPVAGQDRSAGTAILFLLEAGSRSHWHRVDAEELWIHQAGAPLVLSVHDADGRTDLRLGADVLAGQAPQGLVPAGAWQAALADPDGWALVSCVVVPGFRFEGFQLAPPGWEP